MDVRYPVGVPKQRRTDKNIGRTTIARVPGTSACGTLTDLIEGTLEGGERLLAQIYLIFAILVGEIDANAAQPVASGSAVSLYSDRRAAGLGVVRCLPPLQR